jgi:peptide/nickel transport system permease protein
MLRYGASRLGQTVLVAIGVSLIAFAVPRLTGSPADVLLPPDASTDDVRLLERAWGLDDSWPTQYQRFVVNTTTGEFGESLAYSVPVSDLLRDRFPVTLALAGLALLIVVPVGVALGVASGVTRGGAPDWIIRGFAFSLQAAPSFWLGIVLIYVVSIRLGWLPISGDTRSFKTYVLPAVTLAHFPLAVLIRLTRKEVLEVLDSDYVEFARMKGMPERVVIWKHVLRNSLISPLTYSGFLVAALLTGTVIVETIFALPGVGSLAVDAIRGRDFPVIQTLLIVFALIYVVMNFCVDLTYGVIDPRLRRPT